MKIVDRLKWVPIGAILVAGSIFLPWNTRAPKPPLLWLLDAKLLLFGLLDVVGSTLIGLLTIGLWIGIKRRKGIWKSLFRVCGIGVGLIGLFFYGLQWLMYVTNPFNPNPHAADFLAPSIGVYAGLVGSFMILTGVILHNSE